MCFQTLFVNFYRGHSFLRSHLCLLLKPTLTAQPTGQLLPSVTVAYTLHRNSCRPSHFSPRKRLSGHRHVVICNIKGKVSESCKKEKRKKGGVLFQGFLCATGMGIASKETLKIREVRGQALLESPPHQDQNICNLKQKESQSAHAESTHKGVN